MKVGVIGKGGAGKTVVAGVLARILARSGWEVIALDCDANPNLGVTLGVGVDQTERLAAIRQSLSDEEIDHAPDVEQVLARFAATGPDGVRLAVVSKIDRPNPGWPWCGISPEQLLGQLDAGRRAVIADMEAGAGTLTRMAKGALDLALLVTEPSTRSVDVTRRAREIIADRKVGSALVVANRVRHDGDATLIRDGCGVEDVHVVPEDPAILQADRDGVSPCDVAPPGAALAALERLAERLAASGGTLPA